FLPTVPLLAVLFGRVLQILQYAIIARAVVANASVTNALVAQGLNLIALAVGALIPAQVGVSDGAFAMSSNALGTTVAQAISIAFLAHVVQIAFIAAGALAAVAWRARR